MKVDGYGNITNTSGANKKRGVSSSSGNFADLHAAAGTEESAQTASASDVSAPASLSQLLALQEIPDELVNRKKLISRGNAMLDTLEKLRRQLVMGPLSLSSLQDIEFQIAQHKQSVNDPALSLIIEDIELRAAVEVAKLRQSMRET